MDEDEEADDYEDISDGDLEEVGEVKVKQERHDDEDNEVVCLTPAPAAQHRRQPDGSVAIYQPPIHVPYPLVKTEPGTPASGYAPDTSAPDVLNQAIIEGGLREVADPQGHQNSIGRRRSS